MVVFILGQPKNVDVLPDDVKDAEGAPQSLHVLPSSPYLWVHTQTSDIKCYRWVYPVHIDTNYSTSSFSRSGLRQDGGIDILADSNNIQKVLLGEE